MKRPFLDTYWTLQVSIILIFILPCKSFSSRSLHVAHSSVASRALQSPLFFGQTNINVIYEQKSLLTQTPSGIEPELIVNNEAIQKLIFSKLKDSYGLEGLFQALDFSIIDHIYAEPMIFRSPRYRKDFFILTLNVRVLAFILDEQFSPNRVQEIEVSVYSNKYDTNGLLWFNKLGLNDFNYSLDSKRIMFPRSFNLTPFFQSKNQNSSIDLRNVIASNRENENLLVQLRVVGGEFSPNNYYIRLNLSEAQEFLGMNSANRMSICNVALQ
ncbi:MAG: hypothetical protein H6625_10775 [Bdellovibrionaceae bacterium]|nr:hypothetical protein [Pseudobdellovibrionaceae bacterium]